MQGMLRGAYLDDQFSDPPIVIVKMQQQQRGKRRPTCARLFLRYGPDLFIVLLVLMLIGWSWLVWDAFKVPTASIHGCASKHASANKHVPLFKWCIQ